MEISHHGDHGDANLLLYWAEHEARVECQRLGGGLENWKPVKVEVALATR